MNLSADEAMEGTLTVFFKVKGTEENFQILSAVLKNNFQTQKEKAHATLTTAKLQLIPDLLTNLCWSDILFSIKCVHYFQLLFRNQFSDNFYTVPFWQSISSMENNQLF